MEMIIMHKKVGARKHGMAKLIGGVGICYANTMHNSIIPH